MFNGFVLIALNNLIPFAVGSIFRVAMLDERDRAVTSKVSELFVTLVFFIVWLVIADDYPEFIIYIMVTVNVYAMVINGFIFAFMMRAIDDKAYQQYLMGENIKKRRLCRVCRKSMYSDKDICDDCRRKEEMQSSIATAKSCPSCGCVIDGNSKVCPSCGESLVEKCPECGTILKKYMKFCTMCGHKMIVEAGDPDKKNTEEEEDWKPPIHFDD